MTSPTFTTNTGVFPPGERSCAAASDASRVATVEAFRAVMLHTIVDAFDLHWEEAAVVGYRLDDLLTPLLVREPSTVPWAVRRELLEGTYTRILARRQARANAPAGLTRSAALQAGLDDWAHTLLVPVFTSYSLPPIQESRMHLEMRALLTELGIGHPTNPRPALYLPSDLRQRLNARRT